MRHSPRSWPGIAVIALSSLTSMSALGREPSPAWKDVLAIEGQVGLGTPTGLAGLAIDVTPHPRVSLNVGAGRGLYAMQLAAMAPSGAGTGWNTGRPDEVSDFVDAPDRFRTVGTERRWVSMEFARERELVHLRYELRRLYADRRRDEALPILARLRQIAADDTGEAPALHPEIERWVSSFGL